MLRLIVDQGFESTFLEKEWGPHYVLQLWRVFFCRKEENSMMGGRSPDSPRTGSILHADLLQCKWITSISVINVVI